MCFVLFCFLLLFGEQTIHLNFSHDQAQFPIPFKLRKYTVHTHMLSVFVRKHVSTWYHAEEYRLGVSLPASNSGSVL